MNVTASASLIPSGPKPPQWIQYLPPGENTIDCTVDGKPDRITVLNDAAAAQALQADLMARLNDPSEPDPFMAFDHQEGAASGWPEEFRWSDARGTEVRPRWSTSGAAGVVAADPDTLPDYRYFSPTFRWDRDTHRILGLLPRGEIGSLVNNPAFRRIARVAASHPSAPAEPTKTKPPMNKLEDILAALVQSGILTADEAAGDNAAAAIEAKMKQTTEAVACAARTTAELGTVRASLTEAQTALTTLRTSIAADQVQSAVRGQRIAAKDTATQEWWKARVAEDTTGAAVKALNALAPIVPAPSSATPPGATVNAAAPEDSPAAKARAAQVRAKAQELQGTHPRKSWADLWHMAECAIPPV